MSNNLMEFYADATPIILQRTAAFPATRSKTQPTCASRNVRLVNGLQHVVAQVITQLHVWLAAPRPLCLIDMAFVIHVLPTGGTAIPGIRWTWDQQVMLAFAYRDTSLSSFLIGWYGHLQTREHRPMLLCHRFQENFDESCGLTWRLLRLPLGMFQPVVNSGQGHGYGEQHYIDEGRSHRKPPTRIRVVHSRTK